MSWWAVYTEPRRELFARDQLLEAGYAEVFCPFERITRRDTAARTRHKPVRTFQEPIFPRYLFIANQAGELDVPRVNAVRGVATVVKSVSGRPLEAPNEVIEALRKVATADGLVAARDLSKFSSRFTGKPGDRFIYRHRPFEGLVGCLSSIAELDATGNVRIWLNILGGEREIVVNHKAVGRILPKTEEAGQLAA
jgi:transcription antitermination factor NusG